MSVIDSFEAPGFREWEAVDLRLIMHQCGLLPEGDGLWIDEPDEINGWAEAETLCEIVDGGDWHGEFGGFHAENISGGGRRREWRGL